MFLYQIVKVTKETLNKLVFYIILNSYCENCVIICCNLSLMNEKIDEKNIKIAGI